MKKIILLKYLKIINLKIILLNHQNDYVYLGNSNLMSIAAKSFNIPTLSLSFT